MWRAVLVLMVVAGGAVGAPLRFFVDRAVTDRTHGNFPFGTVLINVSGSLVLGLLAGIGIRHAVPSPVVALVGTGLCGAFTTFSAWSYQTIELIERAKYVEAGLNVLVSLIAGLVAAGAGLALGWVV